MARFGLESCKVANNRGNKPKLAENFGKLRATAESDSRNDFLQNS